MRRRKNWDIGNVLEITLEDGTFSYGVVVPPALIAFSPSSYPEKQDISIELFREIAFKLGVMNYAIGKKHWPVVGYVELTSDLSHEPVLFKFDTIAKKFQLCDASYWTISEASYEQCRGLEAAAVWDPEHVESRLYDAKRNVPNKWVDSLSAENFLPQSQERQWSKKSD